MKLFVEYALKEILFYCLFVAIFTDEALSLHEHQVQVMGNYFKENEHIFVKVEKRESVWKKKIEFEVSGFSWKLMQM